VTAAAIAAVAGYVMGFAASRLAGASLALGTWGVAWLAYVVLVQFPRVSGGSQGLTRATPAHLVSPSLGLTVTLQPWVHALAAGLICVVMAAMLRHAASGPWGLDWAALRTGAAGRHPPRPAAPAPSGHHPPVTPPRPDPPAQ